MSKIKSMAQSQFCYPAPFPAQGRLPTQAVLVGRNCRQQESLEHAYHQELCLAANRRVEPPCGKTLHISLFFDGTGNNLNNDLYLSNPKNPSNIARLFRATIGTGYVGGADNKKDQLLDLSDSVSEKYFKYYIPGVGTPFPEIGDLDYSALGLATANYGEDRINWSLLRLIDVLKYALTSQWMNNDASLKSIEAMNTTWAKFGFGGAHNRYEEFTKQLKQLDKNSALRRALSPAEPGKPKLLGIKLYIYGFSRGAAQARTFVKWLSELLPKPLEEGQKPEQCLTINDLKIPLSVEFLGLLDTVASVGIAHIVPVAEGHMAWADGTQELPDEATHGGLIKKCVHLISAHEQRLCFPLDSLRRANGQYPANSLEIIYPGMHSDLGGGYPSGDQGKAIGEDKNDDSRLLSQITLHDMYQTAFAVGAPLKVPKTALPQYLMNDTRRSMPLDIGKEFDIDTPLVNRFNAWREVTLGLSHVQQNITAEQAAQFAPIPADVSLESAIENQIAWITAWRIGRYADKTLFITPFYERATDRDSDQDNFVESKKIYEGKVDDVRKERLKQLADHRPGSPAPLLVPGPKDFDPDLAKTQLRQAAIEFGEDYRQAQRSFTSLSHLILETIPQTPIYMFRSDDVGRDFLLIKGHGKIHVPTLFPPQGEDSNASEPSGLLRALFDDQVHDSRAWFLHYALGSREPFASYFLYRMIYFGEKSNKQLSLLTVAGNVVGAMDPTKSVIFRFLPKSAREKVTEIMDSTKSKILQVEALDFNTQQPLAMLPDADQVTAFTYRPGAVSRQQTHWAEQQEYQLAETRIALQKSKIESSQVS